MSELRDFTVNKPRPLPVVLLGRCQREHGR